MANSYEFVRPEFSVLLATMSVLVLSREDVVPKWITYD